MTVDCVSGDQCIVCQGVRIGDTAIARADDGIICSNKCWMAFMQGNQLLAKVKNFSPWRLTRVR